MSSRYVTPILLLIGAVVLGLYFLSPKPPAPSSAPVLGQSVEPEAPNVVAAPEPTTDGGAERRAALARAKAQQQALLDRATAARAKLEKEFPEELAKWQAEVTPLLENDRGRAIATNAAQVNAFREAYEADKPSAEVVASLSRQLSYLLPPLEEAARDSSSSFVPDNAFTKQLDDISNQATAAVSAYRSRRETIERVLRISQAANPNPSGPTLASAIQGAQDDSESTRALSNQIQREQDQAAELRRTADAATAERARKDAEAAAALQREQEAFARRQELLGKANDPVVQAAFATFLTPAETRIGSAQPYNASGAFPAAVSDIAQVGGFADLRRLGLLIRNPNGIGHRPKRPQGDPEAVRPYFQDFPALARIWVSQCKLLETAADAGKPCTPSPP